MEDVTSTEAPEMQAEDDDNYMDGADAESSVDNEQDTGSGHEQVVTDTEFAKDEQTESPPKEEEEEEQTESSPAGDAEDDFVSSEPVDVADAPDRQGSFERVDVVEQEVAAMGSDSPQTAKLEIVYCGDGNPCAEKSALTWALIHLFAVHACGIDRCYMGNIGMGVAKGLTLGGCGIWALIDHVVFLYVALQKKPSIDMMGIKANFEQASIQGAFIVAIICLVMIPIQGCCGKKGHSAVSQRDN